MIGRPRKPDADRVTMQRREANRRAYAKKIMNRPSPELRTGPTKKPDPFWERLKAKHADASDPIEYKKPELLTMQRQPKSKAGVQ